jgi:hypothetical protein
MPEQFWRLTPSEWNLRLDGHADALRLQERRIAKWISPLLSVSAGKVITATQLLGEEAAGETEDEPTRVKRAERELKIMMRKLRKGKRCPA